MATVLSSKWSGLNPSLLASVFPVDDRGVATADGPTVVAPVSEGNVEITANWQSAFEQANVDSRLPALTQMLQTGVAGSYGSVLPGKGSGSDGDASGLAAIVEKAVKEGQGRTGMTKLNSTQVFTGAAPVKLPLTLRFRAFDDPQNEVQAPLDQLARWVLSRGLARDGALVSAIKNFSGGQGFVKSLLPSLAPQMVGLRHGGYTFAPLVIESMTFAVTGPRASNGALLSATVQLMLTSLTALDQEDWNRSRRGQPIQLWNN